MTIHSGAAMSKAEDRIRCDRRKASRRARSIESTARPDCARRSTHWLDIVAQGAVGLRKITLPIADNVTNRS